MNVKQIQRLAALERKLNPPVAVPLDIVFSVIHIVPEEDPRCGTWSPRENLQGWRSFDYFGRDLAHIAELQRQRLATLNTTDSHRG